MFIDKNGCVRRPVCYMAGFEMFYADGAARGERYHQIAEKYGIIGIFPPDKAPEDQYPEHIPTDDSRHQREMGYFIHDINHLRRSDMIIANLNDYHGQEPDSGTAFECGVAYGLGYHLYAFIDDGRPMVQRFSGKKRQRPDGRWEDENGAAIEDFDQPLNLMFNVPMTVVEGDFEAACKRARADFDKMLAAAGHPPFEVK